MANQKNTAPKPRNGELAAKPIMVYPNSPEQRTEFEELAKAEGRSLSNFMVNCAQEHVAASKKTLEAETKTA